MGRTKHIAWAMTAILADTADVYEEKLVGTDKYMYDGKLRDIEQVKETIKVKDGNDVHYTFQRTHHGPLLEKEAMLLSNKVIMFLPKTHALETGKYSLRWAGAEPNDTTIA